MNTKYKVQLTKDELNKFNFLQESYKGLDPYTKIVRNFKRFRKVHQVKYE